MPKTTPPGEVTLDHGTFQANVQPDVFDARDLDYRPRLQVIPHERDWRAKDRYVMKQVGNSCTGHAVAAMVNAILAQQSDPTHVSPYMLYALARRYDEFEGEADVGSSLRGALKGWYNHGLLPDTKWPRLDLRKEPALDEPKLYRLALERPLGAFYRVNATRLDDMQSAINELYGIVASASIHDGWARPRVLKRTVRRVRQELHVIERNDPPKAVGGHAFCIVGYNDIGFLIQNSWGDQWGNGGLRHAALRRLARVRLRRVGRPARRPLDRVATAAHQAAGPGCRAWPRGGTRPGRPAARRARREPRQQRPALAERQVHQHQSARSTASSTTWMNCTTAWSPTPRRVVLYAHGGLNSERTGLDIAQRQLNWWLSNRDLPHHLRLGDRHHRDPQGPALRPRRPARCPPEASVSTSSNRSTG